MEDVLLMFHLDHMTATGFHRHDRVWITPLGPLSPLHKHDGHNGNEVADTSVYIRRYLDRWKVLSRGSLAVSSEIVFEGERPRSRTSEYAPE